MSDIALLAQNFLLLFMESAPWLLLGLLVAGLMHELVPISMLQKHMGSASTGAVGKAAVIGAPLPLCSCGVIPAAVGFALGAAFLFGLDKVLPHLHVNFKEEDKEGIRSPWHKSVLLTLAITLHNIPEGLAVGVLFGGVAAGFDGATIGGAVALAIGIGLQNFPEGFAVAMPLRRQGFSRWKSFNYGQLSAIVEPIAAVVGAYAVMTFQPILPYALAFAAGAMIFVVVEEVVPETQQGNHTDIATMGFIGGFILMMTLDVGLG